MAATYKYLTATAQVKIGATKLKSIVVASGTNPTVAIYDTATAATSGTNVLGEMTFSGSAVPSVLPLTGDDSGVNLSSGLYVVLGGSSPVVTVIYE